MANKLLERKTFELKELSDGAGGFEGYAAVTGNVDRGGDIIQPGAFVNLEEFVKEGFITFNHEWYEKPIGYIVKAYEDANGLFIVVNFHDTDEGQECRKIVNERLSAGKFVGLSIGYRTIESTWEVRESDDVRILKAVELFETAITLMPMNPEAHVTSAKDLQGSETRLRLEDHLNSSLLAVADAAKHLQAHMDMKDGNGRRVSPSVIEQALQTKAELDGLCEKLQQKPDEEQADESAEINAKRFKLARAKILTRLHS